MCENSKFFLCNLQSLQCDRVCNAVYCTVSTSPMVTMLQWLRRVWPGSRDVRVTSERGGGVHGGRYVTLEHGVGRVDVTMTSSGSTYESTLVVDDVRAEDAGLYICSLSTAAGHISSTHAYLNVLIGTLRFSFCLSFR